MVLETKNSVGHNDYGSIGGVGGGVGGTETRDEASSGDAGRGGNGMTQSDLYQRQPLLSATGSWPNGTSPQATTHFYRSLSIPTSLCYPWSPTPSTALPNNKISTFNRILQFLRRSFVFSIFPSGVVIIPNKTTLTFFFIYDLELRYLHTFHRPEMDNFCPSLTHLIRE